jgi:endonuclease/exonuclease/phosphatase (EEP) superfamily protein YafD
MDASGQETSLTPKAGTPSWGQIRATLVWLLRLVFGVLAVIGIMSLVLMAASLEFIGQHNLFTAFLMFVPAWVWAAPLACLIPFLLLLKPRLGLLSLALVLLFWGPWLGFRWTSRPVGPPAEGEIRLLSWNRGQSGGESLQPFKNQVQPNLIALQDAARRLQGYQQAPEYAELPHASEAGEFLLLSAFPIRSTQLLQYQPWPQQPKDAPVAVAARFEVVSLSGPIAVYNVHFPTPRDTLSFYRRGVFLLGLLGFPGTEWGQKRAVYQEYWDRFLSLNQQLADQIRDDPLPVLVAGDFNSPAMGPAHRLFTRILNDSHEVGGLGYGYTFPGKTGNPLALFRSWLRLDRILANGSWHLVGQQTETNRASQHLAVFAAYRPR